MAGRQHASDVKLQWILQKGAKIDTRSGKKVAKEWINSQTTLT